MAQKLVKFRATLLCLLALLVTSGFAAADEKAGEKSTKGKVGELPGDFTLGDFRGKDVKFSEAAKGKTTIVAFLGTECPLAKLYAPRLAEIAKKYTDRGVVILGVMSNQQDSQAEIASYAKSHGIEFSLLRDPGNVVADQFGAE